MEYWKRYCSSWPVRTLKSCLEALENPVLEVPARHGSRGSNSSFRTPSSRPTRRFHPLASSFCYPKPLPPKHTVTSPPSSSYVFPRPLSLSLHASMTILWTSTTKFRLLSLSLSHTLLLRSRRHLFFFFLFSPPRNTLWTPSQPTLAVKGIRPLTLETPFSSPPYETSERASEIWLE